jgi:hypothetical protein
MANLVRVFEYDRFGHPNPTNAETENALMNEIAIRGGEGWELAWIVPSSSYSTDKMLVIMKRQLTKPENK